VVDIDTLTDAEFEKLPLVIEGESKIVRDAGGGACVIRFKPTIYSFTANRAGVVPGSDVLRLRASRIFCQVLRQAGIPHAYRAVNDRFVLADLIPSPPPIEVVVKAFHSGTSKHRYTGMAGTRIRGSHPFYAGKTFEPDGAYPAPFVRFDWRNPLHDPKTGKTLADEVLGDAQADWFIDTAKARLTALRVHRALSGFLADRDVVLYDLCLFVSEDGEKVFGEISQDCGRFRHFDLGSLDKDEWRAGGSSEHVLKKWQLLLDLIEKPLK
jgi:phosphoribosylaminoimidazole-succinocarboxamide synthase